MSRKVLDSSIGMDNEVESVMNSIVAQNPQLNSQIETVHNETHSYLCKVLRIYPFEDKAYVEILNTNDKVFCRLSHEVMSSDMSIDYLPSGVGKIDSHKLNGKEYIVPFDDLYGILIKVRWLDFDDENVLISYVNLHDAYDLKSNSDTGELLLKSGSSSISVDNERINIMTPYLFINGLPFDEPELQNYYNKTESDIITNSISKSNTVDIELDEDSENPVANKTLYRELEEIKERLRLLESNNQE